MKEFYDPQQKELLVFAVARLVALESTLATLSIYVQAALPLPQSSLEESADVFGNRRRRFEEMILGQISDQFPDHIQAVRELLELSHKAHLSILEEES